MADYSDGTSRLFFNEAVRDSDSSKIKRSSMGFPELREQHTTDVFIAIKYYGSGDYVEIRRLEFASS
jgi:hypothetical protein